jgi:hypothetical protein
MIFGLCYGTGIELRRRPGMDGDKGVGPVQPGNAPGDKKDRSDFTAVPAALSERWNLPRHDGIRTGIELRRRPGMDGDKGVGPVQPGNAPGDKNRSDFTAVSAAPSERWNLPRPKKHAPGMFLTSRGSAGLSIP